MSTRTSRIAQESDVPLEHATALHAGREEQMRPHDAKCPIAQIVRSKVSVRYFREIASLEPEDICRLVIGGNTKRGGHHLCFTCTCDRR